MIDARRLMTNPAGRFGLDPSQVIGVAIHHSVTQMSANAAEADELAHLRSIDQYHVSVNYGGIGYHAVAFPSGRLYQVGDFDGARAHVASRNHELIGVCAIGTFTDVLPSTTQLEAIAEGIKAVLSFYEKPLEIRGHNGWATPGNGTACAGKLNGFDWTPLLIGPPLTPVYSVERILLALQAASATLWVHQSPDFVPSWDRAVLKDVYGR